MKNNINKRIVSLVMTFVMLLSYFPATIWAVDSTSDIKEIQKPTGWVIVEDYDDYFGDNWVDKLELPQTVKVTLADNSVTDVPVTWDTSVLDTRTCGYYSLPGTLALPAGATNGNNLSVSITIQVRETVNLYQNPGFEDGRTHWSFGSSGEIKGTPAATGQYALQVRSSVSGKTSYNMLVPNTAARPVLAKEVMDEGAGQYYIAAQVRDYLYEGEVAHTDELKVFLRLRNKKKLSDASFANVGDTQKVVLSNDKYVTVSGVFNLSGADEELCTDLYLNSATSFTAQWILVDDVQFIPLKVALKQEPANITSIKTEILARSVVLNYPDYIDGDWKSALGLPKSVEVATDKGTTMDVDVTWSYAGLDFTKYGRYTLVGTLDKSFPNPNGLVAYQTIYITKAKNLITNPSFESNLLGWTLKYTDIKPSRVESPVKDGQYAALTGRFTTNSIRVAVANTSKSDVSMPQAVAELGGGQFFFGIWTQYADEIMPDGISIESWFLHKGQDENGVLDEDYTITKTNSVPVSNKQFTQSRGIVELPANTAWLQLALYVSAKKAEDMGAPMYVDLAELIPLNVTIPKGEEPADIKEVVSEIPVRAVVENYDTFVGANWKTQLGLPASVKVRTASGNTASVDVLWDYDALNLKKPGKYTLVGTLDNSTYPNPDELFVTQTIHIIEYRNLLTNPSFESNINGWNFTGSETKPSRVQDPVKDGKYAAMTGKFSAKGKRIAFAYTKQQDEAIGKAVNELGGGQYYYSAWARYSEKTVPAGMTIEAWFLNKNLDENGILADEITIGKADPVALSGKEYIQTSSIVDLPASAAWVQLAVYVSAQEPTDIGVPILLDKAELVPLNIIVEQYEGEMDQVETIIPDRQIIQNYPDYIGDGYTTADLMLPATVDVRTTMGEIVKVGVKWDYSKLNLAKLGTYTLYGVLEDMKLANPDALTVSQKITVVSKRNLFSNPSFEDDAAGWDYSTHVTLGLGNAIPVRDGDFSMKIQVGRLDNRTQDYLMAFNSGGTSAVGQRITKTGAGRYLFSGWGQGTEATKDLDFNLRMWYMCLSNGDKATYAESDFIKLSTTEFTQMANIVEFPDDVYSAHLDFYIWGPREKIRLSTVYLDDMALIPLNIATANVNEIISCEETPDYYIHQGTSVADMKLPEALMVVTKRGQKFDLGVTWDTSSFDANKLGVQYIKGSLNIGNTYKNPKNFTPTIKVIVRAKGEDLRQTIYLSTSGNDSNDGLSPEKPKLSINMIPTYLSQGYNVKLKRGDVWYTPNGGFKLESIRGTEAAPLTLGAYGSGDELPVIAFMMKIENSAWKLVDAKRNIYVADVSSLGSREGINVHRCFVNGESYTHKLRTNYVTLDPGEVCNYGGKLYIRMETGAPNNVEVTPLAEKGYPIHIENVSYLNIEFIHIKGTLGLKALIRADAPTEFVKFRYCSITHGFYYHMMWVSDDEQIHYKPEISNCFMDAMFNEVEGFYRGADDGVASWWNVSATEAITLRDGVDGAWIHHNTIRNMSHVFICLDSVNYDNLYTTTGTRNCIIEDNLLEGGNVMYARPFSCNGVYNLSGIQMVHDNVFRRNRCYDMSSSCHFFGENNLFYSNVFSYYHTSYNEDGTLFEGKGAIGAMFDQSVYGNRVSIGNILANNTFFNCAGAIAIKDTAGVINDTIYVNNLIVNWNSSDAPKYPGAFNENSVGTTYVLNNATYSSDGYLDPFVVHGQIYSAEDVNNSVAGYSGNRSGDPLFKTADVTNLNKFIRQDYDLSSDSPYRYAGLSLYSSAYKNLPAWQRMMADYTDVNGVVYLAESPSIGAYSYNEKIRGDVAEVGKLDDILARPGAKFEQLNLPDAVPAKNEKGIEVMLLPTWSSANFDSSKPGTITLTAQLRNGPHTDLNINGKVATININIKDRLELLGITTVLTQVTVPYGTSLEDAILQLPQTLDVQEESGFTEALPVKWACENYNPIKPDSYTFKCVLPEDMITNAREFVLEVEVRVLHEIGRGMELLVNPDFIEGTSAAPWKYGWGSGNFKITTDPQYLKDGEPAAAIVTATSRYASIQQNVLGQMQMMGDGQYLFKMYVRAYDPGKPVGSSVAMLKLTGAITNDYFTRTKTNIGSDWVEYNTVMNVTDVAQATEIMFHTSTYKTHEDVEDKGISYIISGASLVYLGKNASEVEATLDSIDLVWNLIKGENSLDMNNVMRDLKLPASIGMASTIKWTSSDESAITNDGKVTMGRIPKTVKLTATITYKGIETIKKFTVTVPRNPELPTFTGSLDGDKTVMEGEEFKVTISLKSDKATNFNAYRFTLSFNSSKLEYVGISDTTATVVVDGGRITISGIGTERPITDTFTVTFKAKKSGITEVKLVRVEMDNDPGATMETLPLMNVDNGAATIDVQKLGADENEAGQEAGRTADSAVVWIIIGIAAAILVAGGVTAVILIRKKKHSK